MKQKNAHSFFPGRVAAIDKRMERSSRSQDHRLPNRLAGFTTDKSSVEDNKGIYGHLPVSCSVWTPRIWSLLWKKRIESDYGIDGQCRTEVCWPFSITLPLRLQSLPLPDKANRKCACHFLYINRKPVYKTISTALPLWRRPKRYTIPAFGLDDKARMSSWTAAHPTLQRKELGCRVARSFVGTDEQGARGGMFEIAGNRPGEFVSIRHYGF